MSKSGASGARSIVAWLGSSGKLSVVSGEGAACEMSVSAIANSGQVAKSGYVNRVSPCSSDVFIRMKRTNSTLPASIDTFCFRSNARSDARPNKYHNRQSKARLGSHLNN
ncbi:hypothetical protein PHMEG_00011607 [Phytophthora megakarya]|uniref:Uncharacterized protein n=1 Tax=Phytophthora megakarya TaxID=4795 RepID=A0A225WC82_9STRA|nr:hypothetical protein PHMEG_00011607 [Phytophthora megakarya]